MKFIAILTKSEVNSFISDLYDLEEARITRVSINPLPKSPKYKVTLFEKKSGAGLLESSFNDGMLKTWGWAEKFKKIS